MQPDDVVLPVVLAVLALGPLRAARRRRTLRMPVPRRAGDLSRNVLPSLLGLGVLGTATAVQMAVGGWRWQLIPAAAAASLLAIVLLIRASGRPAMLVRAVAGAALLGSAASLALSWALPLRILPEPDGPHAVGTSTIVLRDELRPEVYGPAPGGAREIVMQVWYPAAPDGAVEPAPLIPQAAAFSSLGAAELGLPAFALSHIGLIPSNATLDAIPLDGPLPVVLIAHGWTGFRTIQTDLAEQLASQGWLVAAADHRYGALVTTFPDGRADLFDSAALPEYGTVDDDVYAERSSLLIRTFAEDLGLMIRTLDRDPPPLLRDSLDLSSVAFVGHSTGGGAALAACAAEPRCAAVVGFDPWIEPVDTDVRGSGVRQPVLSLRTQDWLDRPNEIALQDLHRVQREAGRPEGIVGLDGALHGDFTLVGALSPVARLLGFSGATPGAQTRAATIVWTASFLDHHVRGVGEDPLLTPPPTAVGRLEVTP